MKFKVGDIVKLKSGGVEMTVTSRGKRQIGVAWMFEGELHQANLPSEALVNGDTSVVDAPDETRRDAELDRDQD
jgi:uncharacterized protein YodC (DUF2158 family)